MTDVPDDELLRQFARNDSEAAFNLLVERHIALVHSVALRHTANPQQAEDITQAVFIILSRKAASLGRKTILPGWLYNTARLTAANLCRTEAGRVRREQEAFMQTTTEATAPENVWRELSPLLDDAMAHLGQTDRDALVLRYFQNKKMQEVGAALGIEERAAQKRVSRALEKLRTYFTKRGVVSTTTMIAGAVSAHSVQAAPVALAKSVTIVAVAKGAAASASTLTLIKGALKFMAWTNAKTAVVVASAILATGTTVIVVNDAVSRPGAGQSQRLEDGSMLVLNRVLVGSKLEIVHGTAFEKFLGNAIPSSGVTLLHVKMGRPTTESFGWGDKSWLVAEFRLTGPNTAAHALVKPAFYHQFRFVVYGESGIEYVQELSGGQFKPYPEGYCGYIATSRFPRVSKWLGFRLERRESEAQGGPWLKVADFKIKNPARPEIQPWVADSVPCTNSSRVLNFVLREVTVEPIPYMPHDIWNHLVTAPMEVRSNGVLLTNWSAAYLRVEDASGNWDSVVAGHRSLDPRYVWKLDTDFEPVSDFAEGELTTIELSKKSFTISTNVMNVPITISWDGYWLDAHIPTNRPDIGLRFVDAEDDQGQHLYDASGSWNQYEFRKGSFMFLKDNIVTVGITPTEVKLAVVPNVHTTFYTQPRLESAATTN